MRIRIIIPYKSVGLGSDANIYKNLLLSLDKKFDVIISSSNDNLPHDIDDVHIYVSNASKQWLDKARFRLFMSNHELFYQNDNDRPIYDKLDMVLCKTKIGYDWVAQIKEKYNFKYKIEYTKFTTDFPVIDAHKTWNIVLHSAGEHHWKQTDAVIKAWKKYPDLPLLILTCTNQCYENIKGLIKNGLPENIFFHKKLLDKEEFVKIKNNIGIHLCPSIVEGYGHYINEARKVKSLVITTNYPPMNELINKNSGILIDCSSTGKKKNGVPLCFVTEDDIYKAVMKAINMSIQDRITLINNAYEKYVDDTDFFKKTMGRIFEELQK